MKHDARAVRRPEGCFAISLPLESHICSQRMGKVQIGRHSLIHYHIAMLFYSFVGMVDESSYTMHVVWKVIWHLCRDIAKKHCKQYLI